MSRKFPRLLSYTFFAFFAFAVIILFPCCELYGTVGGDDTNIEGALPSLLQGEWAYVPPSGNSSEGYIINEDNIEYVYYGTDNIGADFKGKVVFVSNYSSTSGLIIIQYTVPPTYSSYNDDLLFCATYYRNLRSQSVQLANATTLPYNTCPDTATLEEAIAKFTRMTIGNYVNWSIVMPQTRIK
jgi:hypothetical protein